MNERYKDLYLKAWLMVDPTEPEKTWFRALTELVVKECIEVAAFKDTDIIHTTDSAGYITEGRTEAARLIKEHFEIEEHLPVITVAMVKKLRDETNHSMMECKKALYECDGNHEQATQWLNDMRRYR